MFNSEKLGKSLRLILFFGNNWTSLIGGAMTSASAVVLVGFWVVSIFGHGGSTNPYLGIVFDVFLPGLFVLGLVLIPIGIWLRRKQLTKLGQIPSVYPRIELRDPVFRRGIEIVLVATLINFIIVGTASYRARLLHGFGELLRPELPCDGAAMGRVPGIAALACGLRGVPHRLWILRGGQAKVNGTKQLVEVTLDNYPRPILAPLSVLRPARATCEECHSPTRFVGEKLLVETMYGDDEKNSVTHNVLALHLGGVDSLSHLSGIHGHHLDDYEYVATDSTFQTIIAVSKHNADGSTTQYVSSDWKGPVTGVTRRMDCMDCHNQATHTFQTAEDAIDEVMVDGTPSASLPFVHKEGLQLIQAEYASQAEAATKIASGLDDFYRTQYPAVWSGPARPGGRGGQDPGRHLPAQRLSRDEGDLGDLSQRHGAQRAGAQSIAGMLPLPRREPYVEGRQDDHQRLHGLPQSAGQRRGESEAVVGPRPAIAVGSQKKT